MCVTVESVSLKNKMCIIQTNANQVKLYSFIHSLKQLFFKLKLQHMYCSNHKCEMN